MSRVSCVRFAVSWSAAVPFVPSALVSAVSAGRVSVSGSFVVLPSPLVSPALAAGVSGSVLARGALRRVAPGAVVPVVVCFRFGSGVSAVVFLCVGRPSAAWLLRLLRRLPRRRGGCGPFGFAAGGVRLSVSPVLWCAAGVAAGVPCCLRVGRRWLWRWRSRGRG